jgi:hypothetical protein
LTHPVFCKTRRKQVQQTFGKYMRRQWLLFLIKLSRKRLNKVQSELRFRPCRLSKARPSIRNRTLHHQSDVLCCVHQHQLSVGSVAIATGSGLDGPGTAAGRRQESLFHNVQTGSWAHPAFYPLGTGGSFCGGKTARA